MDGHAVISPEVLGSYAADAAREVDGVHGLVEGQLPRHRGVRVTEEGDALAVELHLALEWGVSAAVVGAAVQERVHAYLGRMADVTPATVDVVIDEIAPPLA